jgi:Uma2 family endonuclease
MATATLKNLAVRLGPASNGILMTPRGFDRAEFVEGWRYELINGVLVVSSTPLRNERDPNEEIGHLLRVYRDTHPQGAALDATLSEETVVAGKNRRRADRVIWAGLGRLPRRYEPPTIIVEFVSAGRRQQDRDYKAKRKEYMAIVKEYWIIDRFQRIMTVFSRQGSRIKRQVLRANQEYRTDLLPGFVLPLGRILDLAERWTDEDTAASEGT